MVMCSVWCMDSAVNDPNSLLQVLTSLTDCENLHKFSFSGFPIRPYNFPIHLYMSAEHSTNALQPFMQALIQSDLWAVLSSSSGVLGSHAVYLTPQLLLWTVFLVFQQLNSKKNAESHMITISQTLQAKDGSPSLQISKWRYRMTSDFHISGNCRR